MSTINSTPMVIGRTLRILANELLLLAEICQSIKRCADALEAGHA